MARLGSQLRHAWNAFVADREETSRNTANQVTPWRGQSTGSRPDIRRMRHASDKTILTAIYVRLGVDASGIDFRHVRLDERKRYQEDMKSGLNDCLTVEANIDQAARAFFLDIYMSMFDNGFLAIVPVDTTLDPGSGGGWDVNNLRVGDILEFMPQHVRVSVLDETNGQRSELVLPKKFCAIVYNPFYSVMNDNASVLQRLVRKLGILDTVDEASASGKLDILIQLPYVVRGKTKEAQAAARQKALEVQLKGSQYGIGYIDATEKVVQLNRPAENNLQSQIEYLVKMLYSQLGLSPEIMDGTADEPTMLNYFNRTIEPLVDAVRQAMVRSFLTKTARTQGQDIMYFRDPFSLLPLSDIADIADKLSRNEILSPNEIRQKLGFGPSQDPKADQLNNSNMPGAPVDPNAPPADPNAPVDPNAAPAAPAVSGDLFDQMNKILDETFKGLGQDPNGN